MKVYLAGRLSSDGEKEVLERIDSLCKKLGFETFLPHRDIGLVKGIDDVDRVFKGDILEGFKGCGLVIASLNGFHVGAGTSWELGYAYAKRIPSIGLKTDESVKDGLNYLSAILIGSMPIVSSMEELELKIREILNLKV